MPLTGTEGYYLINSSITGNTATSITVANTIAVDEASQWFAVANATSIATGAWCHWIFQGAGVAQGHVAARQSSAQWEAIDRQHARDARDAGLAQRRARALLVQHLTTEQRRTYEAYAYFDVDVGGKTYRIRQGTHGNVRLLEKPTGPRMAVPAVEKISFCAQPSGVPDEDAMLAQKLMLETEERKFLEIANWTDLATGRLMDKRALLAAP